MGFEGVNEVLGEREREREIWPSIQAPAWRVHAAKECACACLDLTWLVVASPPAGPLSATHPWPTTPTPTPTTPTAYHLFLRRLLAWTAALAVSLHPSCETRGTTPQHAPEHTPGHVPPRAAATKPSPWLGPYQASFTPLSTLLHHTARAHTPHTAPVPARASLLETISCNRLRPAPA